MATCVTTVNRISLFLFCFGLLHWNTYAIYIYMYIHIDIYNHMIIWAKMRAYAWTKCKHVTFKLNPAARFHWLYSSIINHNLFPTSPGVFSYLTIIPSSHAQIKKQKQLTCSAFFGKVPVYGKKWRTKSDQTTRISTTINNNNVWLENCKKKVNKTDPLWQYISVLDTQPGSLLWVCLKKEDAPKIAIQWEIWWLTNGLGIFHSETNPCPPVK